MSDYLLLSGCLPVPHEWNTKCIRPTESTGIDSKFLTSADGHLRRVMQLRADSGVYILATH
ncbi:hypothetical protein OUZ56_026987 [Daphnia magna]|uniref:Uncharacterized protein n=1 Tax=Daphnia magna TaxID=35525 RepID=A0ABQ9ZNE5_9CRUS|nr:hypothetical protein OUZ56_026987 [Daphnia magna]